MLKKEIIRNKPCDLEDFVIALCEARLQGKEMPETAIGHNGGDGSKLAKKNIIKIMRKASTVSVNSRRSSLEPAASFTMGHKRGSFTGTPLIDLSAKRGSISIMNRFSLSAADSMHNMETSPVDSSPSHASRRSSIISTTSPLGISSP